jgi:hypothetical protein
MGTFAETAIVAYLYLLPTKAKERLFFVSVCSNQRKFAVSIFHLQKMNGIRRFLLALFSVCGIPKAWRHRHGDMDLET